LRREAAVQTVPALERLLVDERLLDRMRILRRRQAFEGDNLFADRARQTAALGSFALAPVPAMGDRLERDYESIAGMIFGEVPAFDEIMVSVLDLER